MESQERADTLYLDGALLNEEPEILFQGEIPGIFGEEALRSHNFSMVRRHFHQSLELYFLLEGERFYFVEQDTYHIKQQMAILVDQNQIHKTCPAGTQTCHHRFLLQLEGETLNRLLKICGFNSLLEFGEQHKGITWFSDEEWEMVLEQLKIIKREMKNAGSIPGHSDTERKISTGLVNLYTAQLLLFLTRVRNRNEAEGWKGTDYRNLVHTGMYQKVHEIALYLQNHSAQKICLDELSARFFISRSYLTRIFRRVTGFTVNEYQTVCRIKKAQILLKETSMTMTEIAMETGFGSLPYFERVFRQETDQTPVQYKKLHHSP